MVKFWDKPGTVSPFFAAFRAFMLHMQSVSSAWTGASRLVPPGRLLCNALHMFMDCRWIGKICSMDQMDSLV